MDNKNFEDSLNKKFPGLETVTPNQAANIYGLIIFTIGLLCGMSILTL